MSYGVEKWKMYENAEKCEEKGEIKLSINRGPTYTDSLISINRSPTYTNALTVFMS
jgi:hypothetical protein